MYSAFDRDIMTDENKIYIKETIVMAKKVINAYESLPLIAKIIIQVFLGAAVGGVYRILKFADKGNTVTLVAGILNFVGLCLVFWVADIITEVMYGKICVLAD